MLEIDSDRLYSDLSKTMDKFKDGSKETFLREHKVFIAANATMAFNFLKFVEDQEKVFSRREYDEARTKENKRSFRRFGSQIYENVDLLNEMGYYFKTFQEESDIKKVPTDEACKTISEKDFVDIILSFYATFGDKYYKIAKKYFDEKRINLNSITWDESIGYYLPIIWLKSCYIFISYSDYNTLSSTSVVHELGHAIDAEMFLFPQQKQISLFDNLYQEIPSMAFEFCFYNYLISNGIDPNGAMPLYNDRALYMVEYLGILHEQLSDGGLEIYETGESKDSQGRIYNIREDLIYGLGLDFGLHLSEIRKNDPKEFFKVLNNLMTKRKKMSLEDAISMSGFDREDFITGKYINPPIEEISMTLKKRYKIE